MKKHKEGMQRIMDFFDIFPFCWQIGRLKRDIELFKQKTDGLFDFRDATQNVILEQLPLGEIPTRECQTWLRKVKKIEPLVKDISELEQKSSHLYFAMLVKLVEVLNEKDEYLDKSPCKHGPLVDVLNEISKRMTSLILEGKLHTAAETEGKPNVQRGTKKMKSQRQSQTKAMPNIYSEKPLTQETKEMLRKKRLQHKGVESSIAPSTTISLPPIKRPPYVVAEGENTSQNERQTIPSALLKGKRTPAKTGEIEVVGEVMPTSETESSSLPDFLHRSDFNVVEHEVISLRSIEISSARESEIKTSIKSSIDTSMQTPKYGREYVAAEGWTSLHRKEQTLSIASLEGGKTPAITMESEVERIPTSVTESSLVPDSVSSSGIEAEAKREVVSTEISTAHEPEIEFIPFETKEAETERSVIKAESDSKIYGLKGTDQMEPKQKINFRRSSELAKPSRSGPSNKAVVKRETVNPSKRNYNLPIDQVETQTNRRNECQFLREQGRNANRSIKKTVQKIFGWMKDGKARRIDDYGTGVTGKTAVHEALVNHPETKSEFEKSWQSFHKQVGRIIDSSHIQPFARAIVAACGDFPLLIDATGKALAEENDVRVWKHALRDFLSAGGLELRDSEGYETAIKQLKFSYERLKARDVKNCFLYCALFPKGCQIKEVELIEYYIQEGIIDGSSEDALKKGHSIVKDLIDAFFLVRVDDGLSIKMHDMTRHLALWIILSEIDGCQFLLGTLTHPLKEELVEGQSSLEDGSLPKPFEGGERTRFPLIDGVFLSRAGARLTEPPPEKEWEQTQMIFLMDNEFSRLPEKPNCQKLSWLFLQRNSFLRTIPETFFDSMPCLRVLNLSKTKIRSLPPSLFRLKKLQILLLRYCECFSELPPQVGNLGCIEVLDMEGTEICKLPDEIGKLTLLKHLRLSFYGSIDHSEYSKQRKTLIAPKIISKFLRLKGLRINVHPSDPRWDINAESVVQDLESLNDLSNLHFYFPEARFLQIFIQSSPSWKRDLLSSFKFVVGRNIKRIVSRVPKDVELDYDREDRCLRYMNGNTIPEEVKGVLARASALYLDHHHTINSVSEFGIENLKQLKFCVVRECPKIVSITDGGVTESVLPNLQHLCIHYLWNLRSIWDGLLPDGSFYALKNLSIHKCPMLEFIFIHSVLQCLSSLQKLAVEDCASVKSIIQNKEDLGEDVVELPNLKRLSLCHLPQLVRIWNRSRPKIDQIKIYNCPKLKNSLDIQLADEIQRD